MTSLADAFDAFLIDLDGVVWRGDREIPGVASVLAELRRAGKRIVFVTNNSSRTPKQVLLKLMRAKIPAAVADVVTSAHAVVEELRRLDLDPGSRVHVCGAEGLFRVITGARFEPTAETTDVQAVIVGFNSEVGFEDIRKASDLARSGLPFIASNDDATYPASDGLVPGAGAILAAVERASGRRALVVGKPRARLFEIALEQAGVAADRALFCGDRAETDVAGARAAGIHVALVLTGVTTERDLRRVTHIPDEILDELADLLRRDLPRPTVERRGGSLVAVQDGADLARVRCARQGSRTQLLAVDVPGNLDREASWRVVRRLLVEALAGAEDVEADPALRPYLERLGVDADPQRRLFAT